jgi:hypothetical protein
MQMKDFRELRYPTVDKMKAALEAAEQGPDAVLEFLRAGRAMEERAREDAAGEANDAGDAGKR